MKKHNGRKLVNMYTTPLLEGNVFTAAINAERSSLEIYDRGLKTVFAIDLGKFISTSIQREIKHDLKRSI